MKKLSLIFLFVVISVMKVEAKICKIQQWHFFYVNVYEYYVSGNDCCAPSSGAAIMSTVSPGGSGYSGHYDVDESYVSISDAQADAC